MDDAPDIIGCYNLTLPPADDAGRGLQGTSGEVDRRRGPKGITAASKPLLLHARSRAAPDRLSLGHASLVVANARLVVGEEDLADEVAPTSNARLLEDVLEVLLHRAGRDGQGVCDLGG